MSFHQCTEMFVQLNVLCLGNWLHAPLHKKCGAGEVLVFSIFYPTWLFRPTQLLIWMNLPPYTIIPHCTAIRHFTVGTMPVRKDLLNISANWFTICGAICLTMYESILSNPVDFFDLL